MKPRHILTALSAFSLLTAGTILFAAEHAAGVGAEEAFVKLQLGNRRFATTRISEGKPTAAKRAETAQSQHPFAIIVGCSDSRTSPELVFDQNIGDLFVVRTAGNLVDDHELGSIEYAVAHLGARLIVVLGHERCGAVTAALASPTAPGHVGSLVRDIQPAVVATKGMQGNLLDITIKENAKLVATRIKKEAQLGEFAKDVRVVSGVYDLDTGAVEWALDRPPAPPATQQSRRASPPSTAAQSQRSSPPRATAPAAAAADHSPQPAHPPAAAEHAAPAPAAGH